MKLNVAVVRDLGEFEGLKQSWGSLYKSDPNATIHRSWPWIRGWIQATDLEWRILSVANPENAEYVAFFSIAYENQVGGVAKIFPGGHPFAAHTGFLCDPHYVVEASRVLVQYLKNQRDWDKLHLWDFMDPRLSFFCEQFRGFGFGITRVGVSVCPSVILPKTWSEYFRESVGSETRATYKKRFSRLERNGDIRISSATHQNLDQYLEVLLSLWQQRWGKKPDQFVRAVKSILSSCFESDNLHLQVMWDKETPVAAVAVYMDPDRQTAQCYMSSYDDAYARLSPGNILIFKSIEAAIERGMTEYDFGRGDQDYKYSVFGARERYNSNVTIFRRALVPQLKSRLKNHLRRYRVAQASKAVVASDEGV